MHNLALLMAILLTGVSNTLMKIGSKQSTVLKSLTVRSSLAGYILFGCVTLLSAYAAQKIALRSLTAWASMSNVSTLLIAAITLHEKVAVRTMIGVGLISVGLVIYSLG